MRAIWEGYRLGRRAAWLPGEDYEALLAEPLEQARARLRIGRPETYQEIKRRGLAIG
jgi:ubiquinone biosynthesis protein COQ4